ncbi:MAG: hypothetical protein RLZ57_432 [Actinomycetota bacterium]|jgi:serine phosphatase RsbU (regulator of sigma subunit)
MDAIEKLETAIKMIEEARGVPLSASAVIHRGEMAAVLDALKKSLPKTIAQAEKILQDKDQIIEEGRASAEQLISIAREEVAQMVEQTAIMKTAREEAARLIEEARDEANLQRDEIEHYIDSRLATLEVILNKTQDAVARGRERLAGAQDKDVLSQLKD